LKKWLKKLKLFEQRKYILKNMLENLVTIHFTKTIQGIEDIN